MPSLYAVQKEEQYRTSERLRKQKERIEQLEERIKELEETIDTIAKDYEESHGMDIRNAEWFTAW